MNFINMLNYHINLISICPAYGLYSALSDEPPRWAWQEAAATGAFGMSQGPGFSTGGLCWKRNGIFQCLGPSWEPGNERVKHAAG